MLLSVILYGVLPDTLLEKRLHLIACAGLTILSKFSKMFDGYSVYPKKNSL